MTFELGPPIEVLTPVNGRVPVVVSSPHSGRIYPASLMRAVRLRPNQLSHLEDGVVDRLFDRAPELGMPLLRARFARAYVDANREAFELDADLFEGPLPAWVNASSVRARAGLGTIPSRIGGRAIYRRRLPFDEAERRVRVAYWPYHQALEALLIEARAGFGAVLLLDCHSMPTLAGGDPGETTHIDFALGDRFGRSCAPAVIDRVERWLQRRGFRVARNRPYAGGHITTRYGRPQAALHALQIEVRRGLFMDEATGRPHRAMAELRDLLRELLQDLVGFTLHQLAPSGTMAVTR